MTLYEDDRVVALSKPAGVSMATSSKAEKSEARVLARLLEACGEGDTRGELFLVHRLDVGTSGVVLLARGAEAHRAMTAAFQNRRVRKTYRALVWGHPKPAEGTLDDPLGRDPKDGRKMRVRADGKRALTRYRTLARLPSVADLVLIPETGRTHQIRVHLAAHGHPIVGDDLYGGATRWRGVRTPADRRALAAAQRPLLHAERIEIPDLGIDVAAPIPEDYARTVAFLSDSRTDPDRDKLLGPSFRR
ncbi:MAG TPA: RluA family pseudouridine synthase [Thermoanaerobaculia bacterium]